MYITIGPDGTTIGSHIILELTMPQHERNIVLRRSGHKRNLAVILIERLSPEAIHQYTSATEIRLLLISMTHRINRIEMVSRATRDKYTVEHNGSSSKRTLALLVEVLDVVHRNRISQDMLAKPPISRFVFVAVLIRLRSDLR